MEDSKIERLKDKMRLGELQKIIKILEESNVEEIEIKGIFRKVRISKKKTQDGQGDPAPTNTSEIVKENILSSERDIARNVPTSDVIAIKAPMVGTCYCAPAPDSSPYVEMGDKIHKGKVLCIIEAMKVMNEIESDINGVVEKVLVKNEDPVEYGQELFLIKPSIR